jgi:hypothetical protein
MPQLDWSSILGLVAVGLCWALAVVLFRVGSTGSGSRKLAILLVIEGIALITNVVFLYLAEVGWSWEHGVMKAGYFVHTVADCLMLVLYPAFLAAALKTKLTRFFTRKWLRMLILGVAVVLLLGMSMSIFLGIEIIERMSFNVPLYAALSLLFTYAMVASIHAWLTAPPGIVRDKARSFALAFSFRDICWGFVYAFTIFDVLSETYNASNIYYWVDFIYRLGTLIYVPIIAYGILRTQLFDIDLRIRWTIKQSTVASVFIAVMFVVSEGASQFLSDELGAVTGLLAAGVLMFFLAPLQRFAERVASTAMPNTKSTPEYTMFRKMQVYESALIEAHYEDGVSDRERALLDRLRDSLGVSEADARAMELDLQTRSAG